LQEFVKAGQQEQEIPGIGFFQQRHCASLVTFVELQLKAAVKGEEYQACVS
jgi:hypothetical protein